MNITLKESLQKRSITFLKRMSSIYEIKGYTKMNKDELIAACAEMIQIDNNFESHAFVLSPEAWKFYKDVVKSEDGICVKLRPIGCVVSEDLGFLYSEKRNGEYWYAVPDEIKPIFNKLMKGSFPRIKSFVDLIHQYAQAAVNLYGVIPIDELIQIYNSQNQLQTDKGFTCSVLEKHIYTGAEYCLWNDCIVHEDLTENDFECAKNLIKQTGDKPRYIPKKSEFLRYADWAYYQNTTQLTDFKNFLLHDCGVSDDRIDRLMFDFQVSFMQEECLNDYFEILANNRIILKEYQVREFTEHTMNCFNNTRLWANKAHTPYELLRFYGNSVRRKTEKIGRNDPCPCGSNKKYKKCCGR